MPSSPQIFLLKRKPRGGLRYDFTHGLLPFGCAFSRASAGTYFDTSGTMQTAAADVPRFDYDPATHEARGILIEPSATNYVFPSSASASTWSLNSASIGTSSSVVAPNGSYAEYLSANSDMYWHSAYRSVSAGSGTYTISVYVKAGNYSSFYFRNNVSGEWKNQIGFDLSNNSVYFMNDNISSYKIENLQNGWKRASFTRDQTSFGYFQYGLDPNKEANQYGDDPRFTGDSGEDMYFYIAQLEESNGFATSGIPTTGSSVTRAVDVLSFTIPSGVNALTYTFDDNSTQKVSVSAGAYTVPTNLNRLWIKSILGSAT